MIGWFKAIFSIFQGVSTIWNAFGSHIGLWLPTSIVATKTDFNKLIQLVCLGLTFAIIIGIYALIVNRLIGSSTQIAMGALNGNMVQMVFALTIALVTIVKNLIILITVSLFLCPMALCVKMDIGYLSLSNRLRRICSSSFGRISKAMFGPLVLEL